MNLSNKLLGIVAIIASPFLGLQMSIIGDENTSLGGFFDLIYMLGWMCSIIALLKMKAAGESGTGRVVLVMQLVLLCIANVWNIWVIIDPANSLTLFYVLDFFWPLSNLFMLVTGISVAIAGKLKGWRRWMPLFTGLWLPATVLFIMFVFNNTKAMNLSITYSVVSFSLLGFAVATSFEQNKTSGEYQQREGGVAYKQSQRRAQLV